MNSMSSSEPPMPAWRVIDAYLAGQASPEEQEVVRRWMAESERNATLVESMRASLSPLPTDSLDVDAAWSSVATRVGIGRSSAEPRPTSGAAHVIIPLRRGTPRWVWTGAAAAGVLFVASLGVWRLTRNATPSTELRTA